VSDDLSRLERDLGRLEGSMLALAESMRLLTAEVHELAKISAKADTDMASRQAQQQGAIGLSRWLFASALSIAVMLTSWVGSYRAANTYCANGNGNGPSNGQRLPPRP
jgi:hypothetical protein